jgi:hypothetical protein
MRNRWIRFSHAPKTTPFHGNQPAFLGSSSSRQQLFERRQAVGFLEGFVPANAVDARETHRYAGFVAGGTVHAVEGDFEDDGGRHLGYRLRCVGLVASGSGRMGHYV